MRTESIEIYSDQTNAAIMRHPGRRFPGLLIQRDTLHGLCKQADRACNIAKAVLCDEDFAELDELRQRLKEYLKHYQAVLTEHQIPLPFYQ